MEKIFDRHHIWKADEVLAMYEREKPEREMKKKAFDEEEKDRSRTLATKLFDNFVDALDHDEDFQFNVLSKIKYGGSPVVVAKSVLGIGISSDVECGKEIIARAEKAVNDVRVFSGDVASWYPWMITKSRYCHVFPKTSIFDGWRLRAMRKGLFFVKEILITLEKIK